MSKNDYLSSGTGLKTKILWVKFSPGWSLKHKISNKKFHSMICVGQKSNHRITEL